MTTHNHSASLWELCGRVVKRVELGPFNRDVPTLAALVLHPRRARSDREGLGQVRSETTSNSAAD